MNQQIEQILFGNVGNRITRELAAGMFLAISECVAAAVSQQLAEAQASPSVGEQPPAPQGPTFMPEVVGPVASESGFPAPVGMHVDVPAAPAKKVSSARKRRAKA